MRSSHEKNVLENEESNSPVTDTNEGVHNRGFTSISVEDLITRSDANIDLIDDEFEINQTKLSTKQLEENFSYASLQSQNIFRSGYKYVRKYYRPSPKCLGNYMLRRVPFLKWILKYNVREDLLKDLIAGLTLGIVHIPQNMAYALMAGVPAINGLYVAFFNVLLYVFMGTSRHISTGTYAIVSLMVVSALNKYDGVLYPKYSAEPDNQNTTLIDSLISGNSTSDVYQHAILRHSAEGGGGSVISDHANFISENPVEARVMIAGSMALLVGLLHCLFAILHVGVVTKYLSDSIVNGFTIGAAYHVVTSQISTLLGIKLDGEEIPFVLIGEYIEIFKNIAKTNIATLIISIVSCIFLYLIKHFVNERYKLKMPAPVPVELLLVVIGTVISYLCKFNYNYKVKTVGYLPLGIPAPTLPPLSVFPLIIGDSVGIAIVSFALNISMAKLFAKKHKYHIRPNQELFAYGFGNIIGSFFSGFPTCVGLSRTVIFDSVGGKTQIAGVFSTILILIVILFLGPLFRDLPNACLAAIIVVALKDMVLEVRVFPSLLKKNKMDAAAWLATFLGVFILNVDVGLYIGVGFSLLLVILRTQRARTSVLGNIPGTSIYEDVKVCEEAQEFQTIKIIRYEESVYYANVDNFKYRIVKLCGIDPDEVLEQIRLKQEARAKLAKTTAQHRTVQEEATAVIDRQTNRGRNSISFNSSVRHLIIDFSCVNFIDSQGATTILTLYETYKEIGVQLYLTYCKRAVIKTLKKLSFQDTFDFDLIFPSNNDAVHSIMKSYKDGIDSQNAAAAAVAAATKLNDELAQAAATLAAVAEDDDEIYPFSFYKEKALDSTDEFSSEE